MQSIQGDLLEIPAVCGVKYGNRLLLANIWPMKAFLPWLVSIFLLASHLSTQWYVNSREIYGSNIGLHRFFHNLAPFCSVPLQLSFLPAAHFTRRLQTGIRYTWIESALMTHGIQSIQVSAFYTRNKNTVQSARERESKGKQGFN